jgi:hypothetical protein
MKLTLLLVVSAYITNVIEGQQFGENVETSIAVRMSVERSPVCWWWLRSVGRHTHGAHTRMAEPLLGVDTTAALRLADTIEKRLSSIRDSKSLTTAVFEIISLTKTGQRKRAAPLTWQALSVALGQHFATAAAVSTMAAALPLMIRNAIEQLPALSGVQLCEAQSGVLGKCCVALTKRQAFAVMSASFFCFFARDSRDGMSPSGFPSINLDEMHEERYIPQNNSVEVAKLRMHLDYLMEMSSRVAQRRPDVDDPAAAVVFLRTRVDIDSTLKGIPDTPLAPCFLHPLGESIDDQHQMLRADFANEVIGGASLSFGCVQEEIMFSICPEMNCSRLFCTPMQPDEAILIFRAERFSSVAPGTYGFSLAYGGKYADQHALNSVGAAIDASDFRNRSKLEQYLPKCVEREIVKAVAGFAFDTRLIPSGLALPDEVATGNWGCGVFGGNVELKILQQWIACSIAGKTMHYFPFSEKSLAQRFPPVCNLLLSRGVTTRQLTDVLLTQLCDAVKNRTPVLDFVADVFGKGLPAEPPLQPDDG